MTSIPDPQYKNPSQPKTPRRKRLSRKTKFIILGIVVILAVGLGHLSWHSYHLVQAGLEVKSQVTPLQQAIDDRRFDQAQAMATLINQDLVTAAHHSHAIRYLGWIPWVKQQYQAGDGLITAGMHGSAALGSALTLLEEITAKLPTADQSLANLSVDQKKAILQVLGDSPDTINDLDSEISAMQQAIADLPDSNLVAPLAAVVEPITAQADFLQQISSQFVPFLHIAPTILGYPDEQTYLFILQNNTELRPTGGFIGTYGILTVKNGNIKEFKTDNIYNLDDPVKDSLFITPPEPLARYLNITQWFMRDANWDPDFPTTADKVEEFFYQEQSTYDQVDGVIAMTPEVIHDLLALTGPVTVEGLEFTADNFTEKLQYEVEYGYREAGTSSSARKEIIGKVASILLDRVQQTPRAQWVDLLQVVLENISEKHILLHSNDTTTEQLLTQLDWNGAMHQTTGDFLEVVDANLAAWKTDRAMEKTIDYNLKQTDDGVHVVLTLHYKHTGVFDNFFTTRYRTYTRIYVPYGSYLVKTTGFKTNDRYLGGDDVAATVTQAADNRYTVFEGFISAEPQTEEIVTLEYILPESIAQQIEAGSYDLYLQKQAGTNNVTANVQLEFQRNIKSASELDVTPTIDNNKLHFTDQLDTDTALQLDF